jgi:hypothetical protein
MTSTDRRARQILVDALLEELADGRQELYRRQAFGVQPAGVSDMKADLRRTKEQLRHFVGSQ